MLEKTEDPIVPGLPQALAHSSQHKYFPPDILCLLVLQKKNPENLSTKLVFGKKLISQQFLSPVPSAELAIGIHILFSTVQQYKFCSFEDQGPNNSTF